MIEPKEVEIDDRIFIISKIPAMEAREIMTQYIPSAVPKLGDYKVNEALALKLLSYVGVPSKDPSNPTKLITKELINNHIGSWETELKVEAAMFEYNCSFFRNGRASTFLSGIVQNLPELITKILMDSLERLSRKEKQPSQS